MKRFWLILITFVLVQFSYAQKKIPADFCISAEELRLFNYINSIREEYGKKPVKLSASLSLVAKTHVKDLLENHPDTSVCNLSSWSNKGDWTPCCYNAYIPKPECMKKKPKELTPYPYYGYEMAAYFQDNYSLDSLMSIWGNTKQVLDMILTRGNWVKKKWIVVGVGVNDHYVSVWFGQRADKQKKPKVCQENNESDVVVSNALSGQYFYLIIASFSNQTDAKEALRRTKKSGFDNAGILKSGDKHRVYLGKYSSLKEATYTKQQLSPTYREAWILKN